MKKKTLLLACLLLSSCASLTPQQHAILASAETIANTIVGAAATVYAGPAVGLAASNILYAAENVAQAYVGMTIPQAVIAATPGVTKVGLALTTLIPPTRTITQSDVTTLNKAAELAQAFVPAS